MLDFKILLKQIPYDVVIENVNVDNTIIIMYILRSNLPICYVNTHTAFLH